MSDIQLDNNGDLDLSTGSPQLVTGANAVAQNLRIRLRFFLGEWFLDQRLGVPYFEQILGRKLKQPLVQEIFKQVIVTTPGVEELLAFALTFDGRTRQLSLTFRVRALSGDVIDFSEPFVVGVT